MNISTYGDRLISLLTPDEYEDEDVGSEVNEHDGRLSSDEEDYGGEQKLGNWTDQISNNKQQQQQQQV